MAHYDARDAAARGLALTAGAEGAALMLFAGKRLREPIHWHGPIVMASKADLASTFAELRSGTFPPVRAPWDYKRLAAFPADHPARAAAAALK